MDLIVWVADVGSIKNKKFGWCRSNGINNMTNTGTNIVEFVERITYDLYDGKRICLGFECPLFIPITNNPELLTSARKGEKDRPWSAGAGCSSLTIGLSETVWIFLQMKKFFKNTINPTFDWNAFMSGFGNLFIWEAFVTKEAKVQSHHGDAEVAAKTFWAHYPKIDSANSIEADNPFSLVGTALLRAGLTKDISILNKPVVVIKS